MKCPNCASPGYDVGRTCLHCNYIDRRAVRMAPPPTPSTSANLPPPVPRAAPPLPPRDGPPPLARPAPPPRPPRTAPPPPLTQTAPPPTSPRNAPPLPQTAPPPPPPRSAPPLPQTAPPPPRSAPPPLTSRALPTVPTRTAPVVITPTVVTVSGSDWVECSFAGTDIKVQVLLQPQMANCGPATLCMIVRHVTKNVVATGMRGAKVRNIRPASNVTVQQAINFGSDGSDFYDLVTVLQTQYSALNARLADLTSGSGRAPLSTQLETDCSPTTPALCHIAWDRGGHFTMCLGPSGGNLLFDDPYYGAVVVAKPPRPTDAIIYDTSSNSRGVAAASGTIRYAALTG